MDSSKLTAEAFFDLDSCSHFRLFEDCRYVWEGLRNLKSYLQDHLAGNVPLAVGSFGKPLATTMVLWRGRVWCTGYEILGGDVTRGSFRVRIAGEEVHDASILHAGSIIWDERIHIGPGCVIEPGALVQGPTIIGANTEVRQGAYVRGNCLIGNRCVVGHTTEIKASVMLDDAKAGHFAYIGDSILGRATNLGAGAKLANLRFSAGSVCVKAGGDLFDTGLQKFGAILGDHVQVGCNAVTNPGTLLGRGCLVFPVTAVFSGYHEPQSRLC